MASSPVTAPPEADPARSGRAASRRSRGCTTLPSRRTPCGLAMVRDSCAARAGHDIIESGAHRAAQPRAPRCRSAPTPAPATARGILAQMPDDFLRAVARLRRCRRWASTPPRLVFLPRDDAERAAQKQGIERIAASEDLTRARLARGTDRRRAPRQARLRGPPGVRAAVRLARGVGDRAALVGHRARPPRLPPAQARARASSTPTSCRCRPRTLGYKGMVTTLAARAVLPRPAGRALRTPGSPSCTRATRPTRSRRGRSPSRLRMLAHNGEINTVNGNRNWMRARESQLESELARRHHARSCPICTDGASDSASFDEVLELLTLTGRSLPHAIMMMVPEALRSRPTSTRSLRAFYEYHSMQMEPWDGPAALDLHRRHARRRDARPQRPAPRPLDRDHRRPHRHRQRDRRAGLRARAHQAPRPTASRRACSSSTRPSAASSRTTRSRRSWPSPHPGRSGSTRAASASAEPSRARAHRAPASPRSRAASVPSATPRKRSASSSPRWARTARSRSARWAPTRRSRVLSERPRLLFDYFTQQFAQVTNPPLDSIREEVVTSLALGLGPERNLLDWGPTTRASDARLPGDRQRRARARSSTSTPALPGRTSVTIRGLYRVEAGHKGMKKRLDADVRRRPTRRSRTARSSSCSATATPTRTSRRSRRCSCSVGGAPPPHPQADAHDRAAWSSRPATSARCTTSRRSSATAHPRSTRTSRWRPSSTSCARASSPASRPRRPSRTSSTRSARACSRSCPRWASPRCRRTRAPRCSRPSACPRSSSTTYFTGTESKLGGVGLERHRRRERRAARVRLPSRTARSRAPRARSGRAASTSGGATARPHLFNPDTVFRLQHSTRTRRYDIFRELRKLGRRPGQRAEDAARPVRVP